MAKRTSGRSVQIPLFQTCRRSAGGALHFEHCRLSAEHSHLSKGAGRGEFLPKINMGVLLLEGGAEFGGGMSEPDLQAIELAGGFDAAICILPTAAAPDHNHKHAGNNGIRW